MKSNSKNIFLFLILVISKTGYTQQNSLFNTYALDPLQLNIAYAGASCTEANLHYRSQWIGMKEAPSVLQLNAHAALDSNNALGLRINSQSMGLLNNLGANLGYSFRFKIKKGSLVHLGMAVGWSQAAIKPSNAMVVDEDDNTLLNAGKQTANGFDSEFGAMFINKKMKAGFSALHLYNTNPDFTGTNSFKVLPQINTQFSYVFFKGEKIELEPWVLDRITLKGDNVVEGLLKVNFLKAISAGIGYRGQYGLMALIGYKISNINLGYSIDYGTNKNATNLGTSHQIMIGFSSCKKSKTTVPKEEEPVVVQTEIPQVKEEPKEVPIVKEEPKIEPIKETPKEEPVVKEVPKVEPVKEIPKEEPIAKEEPKVEPKKEVVTIPQSLGGVKETKAETKSEPVKEIAPSKIDALESKAELNKIAHEIVFDKNSYSLSDANAQKIKEISKIMIQRAGNITLVGYASPDGGNKERNQVLAIKRAEVVKQFLISQGINANRISLKNGGETNHVNTTMEGNRTVRFE